jgi:hypothetical protein
LTKSFEVKVTDFGLSKTIGNDQSADQTKEFAGPAK